MRGRNALWIVLLGCIASPAVAQLPPPPKDMASWKMPWGADVPGVMSADRWIPKPAGKDGPVVVRDGHFYSGNNRLRFWGVNIAFSGNLPTHEEADEVASRLARFGINAVRIHHADMFPFPNGLFADNSLEKLSGDALDRLDYFVAALKSQGIYSDINLHVSRWWSKAHHWENADKVPEFDKIIDLYDPRLIAADKQYARDLLTHVNAYTHNRYADEPAVCIVEINNENTMFYWGGERRIAELPEPYGSELTKLWNQWLLKQYGSREKLKNAWQRGAQPAGAQLISDPLFLSLNSPHPRWVVEQHDGAQMSATSVGAPDIPEGVIHVTKTDGVRWHLQLSAPGIRLEKGKYYTLNFSASADEPTDLGISVSQAHEPWESLGYADGVAVAKKTRYRIGFIANGSYENARVSFHLGEKPDTIYIGSIALEEGGQTGLADGEDPANSSVARGYPNRSYSPARLRDWYRFTQQTDEAYFVEMRRFLKDDLGVKCPVTGTIGLGPLGTLSQSKMDFVDAHAYWDHPQFPHGNWSNTDWIEKNQPMVDNPNGATLWALAATRVAGKPFTVTEYNHPAPNEWQAECVPMIASYAALQDWDGVFLFAYSHDNHYKAKDHTVSFFDFEGNPQKMDQMPMAARIFLGGAVKPLASQHIVSATDDQMLATASKYYYDIWPFARDLLHVTPADLMSQRVYLSFGNEQVKPQAVRDSTSLRWTGDGANTGTGRFVVSSPGAAVFVGFAKGQMPIEAGDVRIEKLDTPFATLMVVAESPADKISQAKGLLITAVARGSNTGMEWDASRHTIHDHWGSAPPLVEIVHGTISIAGEKPAVVYALTPDGRRGAKLPSRDENGRTFIDLGSGNTIWYEVERE